MIKYVTSRPLWFNVLVAIALVMVLVLAFVLSLKFITKHGSSKTVPAVTGKSINTVNQLLTENGFEMVVQDSVYYDSLPPGVVIKQIPEADQVVKTNRSVYVVINRFVPPDISMPSLIGFSYRNAEMTLNNLGLKVGDTSYRPDFAKNSVLEQSVDGKQVKAGDKVRIGSRVDLVLAGGLGNESLAVPKLTGLTLAEARILLEQLGLAVGIPIANGVKDIESAYIYRQSPPFRTQDGIQIRVKPGQMIDVWLQADPVVDSVPSPPPTNEEQ